MQEIMEESAGIYRDGAGAGAGADKLRRFRREFETSIRRSQLYVQHRVDRGARTRFMLDVAETIVHSALKRTESRGAHQRTDYPDETTRNSWRIRSPIGVRSEYPRIEYLPVTITRWPPGRRVYGR